MALENEKKLLSDIIKRKDKMIDNILKSIRDLTTTVFYRSDPENGDGNIIVSKSALHAYDYGEVENQVWKLMQKLEGYEVHDDIYQKGVGWKDKNGNTKCVCGGVNCEKSEWKESKYSKILKDPNTTLKEKNKAVMEAYEKYGNGGVGGSLILESGTVEDLWEGSKDIIDEHFSDIYGNQEKFVVPEKLGRRRSLIDGKLCWSEGNPKRNIHKNKSNLELELEEMYALFDKKQEYIAYLKFKCKGLNDLKVYEYFNDELGHPSNGILLTEKRNKGDEEDNDYTYTTMRYGCYSQNSFLDNVFPKTR